ncbi:hypothetical protein V5O48_014273 [Marasmius crinis-equi]|uniref:ZZ-type domain-containing protein n=1 Tax=Marasmius crinis-equi TaxID=585013 RepID=A0ABR3EXT0_9AGAR
MFTVKATYRGETRKFTFSDSSVFPSFPQIYHQLYRVFPISHNYYLSKLLFSPDSAVSKSRVLLAREVHGEEDYKRAVEAQAGTKGAWINPLLKFFVYDETPHKLPALPSPFTASSSVASTTPATSIASTLPDPYSTNGFTPISFSLIPPPPIIFSSVSTPVQSSEATPRPHSPRLPQHYQAPVHVPTVCCEDLQEIKSLVLSFKQDLEKIHTRLDGMQVSDVPPPPPAKPTPSNTGAQMCTSCATALKPGVSFGCAQCTAIFCSECGAGHSYFPHVECADGGFKHACSARAWESSPGPSQSTHSARMSSPSPPPLPANKPASPSAATPVYPSLCMYKWCWKCSKLKQGHWYSCESCASNLCPQCTESDVSSCAFSSESHSWKKRTCGHCPQSVDTRETPAAVQSDVDVPMGSPSAPPPLPWPQVSHSPVPSTSRPLPSPPLHIPGIPLLDESLPVHGGVQCDSCNLIPIRGARHKCLDCPDYDLCTNCISAGGAEKHNPFHEFLELTEPGRVVVHTVYSGRGERETTSNAPSLQASSVPEPQPTTPQPAPEPVVHAATCNLCDSRIHGTRYKCTDCPDFDTCEGCFAITYVHHPRHTFVRLDHVEQLIRRAEVDRPLHYAICDSCQKGISGVRFKCMHPQCLDFDLCEDCESHPISVHPSSHPMLKVRDPDSTMPIVARAGQSNTSETATRTPLDGPVAERQRNVSSSSPTSAPPQHIVSVANEEQAPLPTLPRTLSSELRLSSPAPSLPFVLSHSSAPRIPSPVMYEHRYVKDSPPSQFVRPPSPFFYAESERSISPPSVDYHGHTAVDVPYSRLGPSRAIARSPPVLPTPPRLGSQEKEWEAEVWRRLTEPEPSIPSPPAKKVTFPPWLATSVARESPVTVPSVAVPNLPDPFIVPLSSSPVEFFPDISFPGPEAALDDSWPIPPTMTMREYIQPPYNVQVSSRSVSGSEVAEPEVIEIAPPPARSGRSSLLPPPPPRIPTPPLDPNSWLFRFITPPSGSDISDPPTPAPSSLATAATASPSIPPSASTIVSETTTQTRFPPVEEINESRVQLPPPVPDNNVPVQKKIDEAENFWGYSSRGVAHLTEGNGTASEETHASFEKDLFNALKASERFDTPAETPVAVASPLMGELLNRPTSVSRSSTMLNLREILNEQPMESPSPKEVSKSQDVEIKEKESDEQEPLIAAFARQLTVSTIVPLAAIYISDHSVPDGQVFPPGAEFIKSWRMKNSGGRAWDDNTELVWVGGDNLSKNAVSSPAPVKIGRLDAGNETDVRTEELKAPEREGRYVGYYRLRDGEGSVFGESIWLDINVKMQDKEESSESSDEYKSMSSSSVIVMPQAVNDIVSRTSSTTEHDSDNASSDSSSISLISVESDEEWEDSREQVPAEDGDEYIVLYDDDSE